MLFSFPPRCDILALRSFAARSSVPESQFRQVNIHGTNRV